MIFALIAVSWFLSWFLCKKYIANSYLRVIAVSFTTSFLTQAAVFLFQGFLDPFWPIAAVSIAFIVFVLTAILEFLLHSRSP